MWFQKKYDELSLDELEDILKLRQSIFILEQKSFFEDIDGNDKNAIHIFNKSGHHLWAYTRLLVFDDKIILGRVTVDKDKRGNGNGRKLLEHTLKYADTHYPDKDIEIVAMSYLKTFYKSFGFKSISDVYIMDNDPHEDMILEK